MDPDFSARAGHFQVPILAPVLAHKLHPIGDTKMDQNSHRPRGAANSATGHVHSGACRTGHKVQFGMVLGLGPGQAPPLAIWIPAPEWLFCCTFPTQELIPASLKRESQFLRGEPAQGPAGRGCHSQAPPLGIGIPAPERLFCFTFSIQESTVATNH